jgi:hypothetical protein
MQKKPWKGLKANWFVLGPVLFVTLLAGAMLLTRWGPPCAFRASPSGVKRIPYAVCDEESVDNVYTCHMPANGPDARSIMRVAFKAPLATMGPVALQLNGEKALPLKKRGQDSLYDGIRDLDMNDIRAGQLIQVVNRGSYFLVCNFLAVDGWPPPGEDDCQ